MAPKFTPYRQAISRAFNSTLSLFGFLDRTEETLHTWDTSQVTVSSVEKVTNDWFANIPPETKGMDLEIISGGPIYINASLTKNPSAGGTEGSKLAFVGDPIKVRGIKDVTAFKAIKETNAGDAVVSASLLVRTGD